MKTRSMNSKIEIASISKTDKKKKLKKRKIQQTLSRKVDRALKTPRFHEDLTDFEEQESKSIYKPLEQVSQITHLGYTYPLCWNHLTKKVYIEISADDIYFNNNVILYDGDYFAQYENALIIDIIFQHFGTVHIFPNDTSNIRSSESLYSLVSTVPLTQYTLVNISYDCGH